MKSVFSLLVCKAKSLEHKVISIAWGMEVSPHAAKTASSKRWQDNRNVQPKMSLKMGKTFFGWKALFLLPKRMALFFPTLEVLRYRNVGLPPITSTVFHLIRSRSQSSCSVCLMKRILLLQFLTRSTALTGRYSWLAYQKSPVIPWLLQRSAPLKGFWAGLR